MVENVRPPKEKKLSAKQEKLITELISGKTIRNASKAVDINEKTAYTWLRDPFFQQEYNAAKQLAYDEKLDILRSGVSTALATLLKHMTSENTAPYVQVQAASIWLQQSLEIHKMQAFEQRVIELEEKVRTLQR